MNCCIELHPSPQHTITTVLFSDLIGFTTITENLDPEKTIYWLEDYLIAMADCVHKHEGIIIRFIGDAIMVIFGIFKSTENAHFEIAQAANNAAKCALAMNQAMVTLNKKWHSETLPITGMRIGINTGNVISGSIGSPKRREFTVHGDAVNIAARFRAAL